MKKRALAIQDAYVVESERADDDRGWFQRAYSADDFTSLGLGLAVSQAAISHNKRSGTLRGMHYQVAPHEEAKLVRCISGAIFDVIADVRRDSPTFTRWTGVELSEGGESAVYVPEGVAHGFVTLSDHASVLYLMSGSFAPTAARGVRYDDLTFGIEWPVEVSVINERDRTYPDFSFPL